MASKNYTHSKISFTNSASVNLEADAVFTGSGEDVSIYSSITINIIASHVSANPGISVQFSQNNINWDIKITDSQIWAGNYNKTFDVRSRYFRIVYTNGSVAQTSFRLQCIFNSTKLSNVDNAQAVVYPDEMYDAFSRLRVSSPTTIFEVSHNNSKRPDIISEKTTSGGTPTYQVNESCVDMDVDTTSDASVIRQSREYIPYQPGKSFMIMQTGILNAKSGGNEPDCRTRIGLFDDQNGVFFQYTGTTVSVNLRSYVTGSVVDLSVSQTSWNIDKLDGTGVSGIILDNTKAQIFLMDLEWLGVGRIRYGLVMQGKIHYVHHIYNANAKSSVYMTRATLPIRYEIVNTGTTNGEGEMKMICATVLSEGGYEPFGQPYSVGRSGSQTRTGVSSTIVPLVAIRLKTGYKRVLVKISGSSIMCTTGGNLVYYIYHFLSPSSTPLGAESWTDAPDNSAIEYDVSNTTLDTSDAHIMYQGYVANNSDYSIASLDRLIKLTSDIDGVSDYVVLAVQKIGGGSETVVGSLHWLEYHT